MISSDKIRDILEQLGYKLNDKGSYWQCAALYRGGDNSTALQIYKDTGAWKDYVQNTPFMPFKQLLVLTLNTNDPTELKKYLGNNLEIGITVARDGKKLNIFTGINGHWHSSGRILRTLNDY